jgi:hypothetical protein
MKIRNFVAATMALALFACVGMAAGDVDALDAKVEAIAKAKKAKTMAIVEKNKDALVILEFVLKIQVTQRGQQGAPTDRKVKLTATTIGEDGLTICSNSAASPQANAALRQRGLKISSSILSVKIILNDGSDVEAEVVFKDVDLDLMFIRPKEKGRKFAHVKLNAEAQPKMLDKVIMVARMDMSTNRAPLVTVGAVRGIIEGPPKYFVVAPSSPALPAFDVDGNCFGLFLRRKNASGQAGGNAFVLPAEEIADALDQIPPPKKDKPADKADPVKKDAPKAAAAKVDDAK